MDELMTFLRRYELLETENASQDLELDWFAPDRKHLICLLLSIYPNRSQEWGQLPKMS